MQMCADRSLRWHCLLLLMEESSGTPLRGCAYRLASHDLQTPDNNGDNQAGAHTAGTSREVVRRRATIQRVQHITNNTSPPRSRTRYRYRNFWPSHPPSTTIHQRNFPFVQVQPLTTKVTSPSPVTTVSPALSETNKFSSHLPPARRPGDSQPPTQNPSLCVDSRALAEACRRDLSHFLQCRSDGP